VIVVKKILLMLCAKNTEIGSSLLKLFEIKLVTFFETRYILSLEKKTF